MQFSDTTPKLTTQIYLVRYDFCIFIETIHDQHFEDEDYFHFHAQLNVLERGASLLIIVYI